MQYWLFKSEPDAFSFDMLRKAGKKGQEWDGVRNFTARNNMKAMKKGDRGFFYHSNIGKEIVGLVEVVETAHQDPTDDTGQWQCVTLRALEPLPQPVSLAVVKTTPKLANMALVKAARLSVQPVTADEWDLVCEMGGIAP